MDEKLELTASNIRFLLTMKHLLDEGKKPKGARLAEALRCTKPSIHRMTKYLDAKQIVKYENYGVPTFTEKGARLAEQYDTYYHAILSCLPPEFSEDPDIGRAVCGFLAEISEKHLAFFPNN